MKYRHIIAAVLAECWAMEETKFHAMLDFLDFKLTGGHYTQAELEARIGKMAERAAARQEGAVAILPLRGVLVNRASMLDDISGAISHEEFGRAFSAAAADPAVKAIVLDIDSPGGMVQGSDELSARIFAARGLKPIIAHANANMASAAYWVGSAADEIVLMPSAETGSIGIIGIHIDDTASLEEEGIKRTVLSAGKYKAEQIGPLSDEARAYQQARIDEIYSAFVKRIAQNRKVSQAQVRDGFGQGRMVTAAMAIREGMADSIGTLDDVLARFGVSASPAPASARRAFALEREKRALTL